jgi:DNA-directed RNA polymerase subunit RPC12/RpoP
MAIRFICEHCPKQLKAKDRDAGEEIECPHCGGVCVVPQNTDEHLIDARSLRRQASARRGALDRALAHFRAGVVVHGTGVVLTGLGLWFCWFGFALRIAESGVTQPAQRPFTQTGNVLLAIGVALFLAVSILEQVTGYLCNLPVGGRRAWLWISIALRKLALVAAAAYWFTDDAAIPLAIAMLVLSLAAWILWLIYVKVVLWLFWQDDLKGHLTTTLVFGLVVAVTTCAVAGTLVGVLTGMLNAPNGVIRFFIGTATVFTAFSAVGLVAVFSRHLTMAQVALFPTGVTYLLDYFNTMASVRLVLARRV